MGKGKSSLKNALTKVNDIFIEWRHRCEEAPGDSRFGRTFFEKSRADTLDRALTRLCEPLEIWLDEHRDPDETHEALLQLYFDIRAWLRVADTFDDHFVLQISAHGSEVRAAMLCLDPSNFWRRTLPRAARRCCSARRWLRQAITEICAVCPMPAL